MRAEAAEDSGIRPHPSPLPEGEGTSVNATTKRISPRPSPLTPLPSSWPVFRGNAEATGVAGGSCRRNSICYGRFRPPRAGLNRRPRSSPAGFTSARPMATSTPSIWPRATNFGSSLRPWDSPRRPPCRTAGSTSATATERSTASTPPRAGSSGTIRPTARSTPAPTSTPATSCSARKTRFSIVSTPPRASSSGSIGVRTRFAVFPTVADNRGFVAGCDGRLHAIDLRQRRVAGRSQDRLAHRFVAGPAGRQGVRRHRGRRFFAHRCASGRRSSGAANPRNGAAAFRSSAAATPEAVIVGSRDKQVHAFDPKTASRFGLSPRRAASTARRSWSAIAFSWARATGGSMQSTRKPGHNVGSSRPAARSSPRPPWPTAAW